MEYDAVLFDMDGVLLTGEHTPEAVYRRAVEAVLADFEADPDVGEIPDSLVRPDSAAAFQAGCRAVDVPPPPAWGYREHAATVLENERIEAGERPAHDDASVLRRLADAHDLGVVSNNRAGTVSFVLREFDWTELVDAHRGRLPSLFDYDRRKPDPHFVEVVLAAMDADPDGALFVGDRESDVETARRAGVDAALLSRGASADEGTTQPDVHLDDLYELPDVVTSG
jgi:HAD superfamily hydrolase (TIGR01509 family)